MVPATYEVANFLKLEKNNQNIYVWGNGPQIYLLTNTLPPGRIVAAYHINFEKVFYPQEKILLEKVKPDFIILYPDEPSFPYSLKNYQNRFNLKGITVYERIH